MFGKLLNKVRETVKEERLFDDIVGYEPIKKAFSNSLAASKPIHILLPGPPGVGKTRFLRDIKRKYGDKCFFFEATNATKAGITKKIIETRPRYLCIDEIEKVSKAEMSTLLSLMQDGRISETKVSATREVTDMKIYVFATSNNPSKLDSALLSRFFVIPVDEYTKDEFIDTAVKVAQKELKGLSESFVRFAAEQVYEKLKDANIRDVLQLCSMTRTEQDFTEMLSLKMKGRAK